MVSFKYKYFGWMVVFVVTVAVVTVVPIVVVLVVAWVVFVVTVAVVTVVPVVVVLVVAWAVVTGIDTLPGASDNPAASTAVQSSPDFGSDHPDDLQLKPMYSTVPSPYGAVQTPAD